MPSTKPVPPGFVDDLIRNSEKRDAVSGNLLVTTELEGKSVTAPAVLLAAFPDRLRLELQDPVGGVLALLVLNGDRFWFYAHDRAEILTGPVRDLPPGLLPRLSAGDIVRFFLARPYADRLRRARLESGMAEFQGETVRWDGNLAEPSAWSVGDASATYEDYEFRSGLRYPTRIRLAGGSRAVTLAWKDWEPSVPGEKKLFQIPQHETFGRKIKELR
jgi:hypothetical protein